MCLLRPDPYRVDLLGLCVCASACLFVCACVLCACMCGGGLTWLLRDPCLLRGPIFVVGFQHGAVPSPDSLCAFYHLPPI